MTIDERNDEVNKALESRFSQLNAALEEHETRLKAMMVPKNTEAVYRSYCEEELDSGKSTGEYTFYIGMIKLRGNWRLCHASHYLSYSGWDSGDLDWKPIVEASIEDRINAAKHIDKLREAIVKVKEELVPDVEKAIEALATSLE